MGSTGSIIFGILEVQVDGKYLGPPRTLPDAGPRDQVPQVREG